MARSIFEQDNIEVPVAWSQLATKVVASKYFYGDLETGQREHSVKQLVHRVCNTIADRGLKDGYFATRAGRGDVLQRADLAVRQSVRLVQFARLVQRRALRRLRHRRQASTTSTGTRQENAGGALPEQL